jgi:peptide/nickel transport system substrate-binding protein/oligopeptide transport system substrate-binding protein
MRCAIPPLFGTCAILLLGWQVAACTGRQNATVEVVAIGAPESAFKTTGELSTGAQLLLGATAEGLVTLDEQAQVVPGVADRWIVTDDGLSYIFRLRDGTWPDGSTMTAESARAALRSAINGLQGTAIAGDLADISDIRVMTGRVVELRLTHPRPELLMLLAQPELGLLQRGKGGGPMRMKRDKNVAILSLLDPEELGLPAVANWQDKVRELRLRALPASAALARYNRGEASAVLGGKIEQFPMVDAAGLSRGAIQLDPVTGLFGLAVVHDDGFLADPANREAIAMAIDRQGMIAALGLGGWTATNRIVASGIEDDPGGAPERWTAMSVAERQAMAAARVARWRAGKADPVRLRLAMPQGPGADILFARLAADLAKAGLAAERVGENDAADLSMVDAVARYPRIGWFLGQLSCAGQRGLCSAEADALADQADAAPDPATRDSLLIRAEAKLTEANVYIPFGPPIRWSLVRGDTTGFAPNRLGYHPLMLLALRPK